MKQCTICKQVKQKSEFNLRKVEKDGLHRYCKECQRKRAKEFYLGDKGKHKARVANFNRNRIKRIQRNIFNLLSSTSCVDCGEVDPIVLTFDHVRGIKKFDISSFAKFTKSWKTVNAEIEKCQIRCFNCHIKRHAEEKNFFTFRLRKQL